MPNEERSRKSVGGGIARRSGLFRQLEKQSVPDWSRSLRPDVSRHLDEDPRQIRLTHLLKGESSVFKDPPLMVFEAVFEKTKRVKSSVNFMKEDGAYKIMQIQFPLM